MEIYYEHILELFYGKKVVKKLTFPAKLFIGASAGVVGTLCMYPVDITKTRLQATVNTGPLDVIRKILTKEGASGFYKGLTPSVLGIIPEKAIQLAANEFVRDKYIRKDGTIALHHEVLAGAFAGTCQVIATNPMEITKIRIQMQATLPVTQRRSIMEIVKALGPIGLYSGTCATLLRDVPFAVIFFPGYANLKALVANEKGETSMGAEIFAAGTSGAVAAGAVTPADVIKTRLQLEGGREKYKSIGNCFRTIVKDEGCFALCKGTFPRMVVVGPLCAITLLVFEAQKKFMMKHDLGFA